MGSKQTKLADEYIAEIPQHQPITVQTDFGEDLEDILDPRSPNICRTPLNEIAQQKETINHHNIAAISTEQPSGLLRKRFFKGFSFSSNDPRSPNIFLNRTPLIFDDSVDQTLNLDDTSSDLFVETKIPRDEVAITTESKIVPKQEEKNEPLSEPKTAEQTVATPKTHPQETTIELDPRSPSIGVDRTPIILNDDDAPDEEDMIETILSTLSLNISQKLPENKPLDRIRNKKRIPAKVPNRRDKIYEDREILTPAKAPRGDGSALDSPSAAGKRTPLSCVKNNPQFRSKSVEVSGKTIKTRLPLTSFDDTLHKITPVKKILRYSNMENIENSFEF